MHHAFLIIILCVQLNFDVTHESLSSGVILDRDRREELKNTGQSYFNTKGKLVEAKKISYQDCSKYVTFYLALRIKLL